MTSLQSLRDWVELVSFPGSISSQKSPTMGLTYPLRGPPPIHRLTSLQSLRDWVELVSFPGSRRRAPQWALPTHSGVLPPYTGSISSQKSPTMGLTYPLRGPPPIHRLYLKSEEPHNGPYLPTQGSSPHTQADTAIFHMPC